MTIDYNNILNPEQKRSIVSQRISQLAAELYQHSLNKKAFENIGDEPGVESTEKAIIILESAINVHESELKSLPEMPTE